MPGILVDQHGEQGQGDELHTAVQHDELHNAVEHGDCLTPTSCTPASIARNKSPVGPPKEQQHKLPLSVASRTKLSFCPSTPPALGPARGLSRIHQFTLLQPYTHTSLTVHTTAQVTQQDVRTILNR